MQSPVSRVRVRKEGNDSCILFFCLSHIGQTFKTLVVQQWRQKFPWSPCYCCLCTLHKVYFLSIFVRVLRQKCMQWLIYKWFYVINMYLQLALDKAMSISFSGPKLSLHTQYSFISWKNSEQQIKQQHNLPIMVKVLCFHYNLAEM